MLTQETPEPYGDYWGDNLPHPEYLGLRVLNITQRN